jgi:tetratricopeptide (TPR) repeat protein
MSRGSGWVRDLGVWGLLLVCIGGWIMPQVSIDYRRGRWSSPDALLFLPTGEYLSAASLGYQVLIADALYLWSIQYYGHQVAPEGRQYLWRIFDVITDLDPHYEDAYLTGALMMGVDLGDTELAIRMLDKGAAQNPDGWIYPVETGYYAWMNLGDHALAAEYFDRALAIPGVPEVVRRIRAGMAEVTGDKRDALSLWATIYEAARGEGDAKIESIAWQHVYDLKVDLDIEELGDALRRYRADRGGPPPSLESLAAEGYLQSLPVMPTGESYEYEPRSGQVMDPRESGSRADR